MFSSPPSLEHLPSLFPASHYSLLVSRNTRNLALALDRRIGEKIITEEIFIIDIVFDDYWVISVQLVIKKFEKIVSYHNLV